MVQDVSSFAYFAAEPIELSASVSADRAYLNGFEFRYESPFIDGQMTTSVVKRENPLSFTVDDTHRFVTARFEWNSYKPLLFARDDLILYTDNRDGRTTLRSMRLSGSSRAAPSVVVFSSEQDARLETLCSPDSPVVSLEDKLWSFSSPERGVVSLLDCFESGSYFATYDQCLGDSGAAMLIENNSVYPSSSSLAFFDQGLKLLKTITFERNEMISMERSPDLAIALIESRQYGSSVNPSEVTAETIYILHAPSAAHPQGALILLDAWKKGQSPSSSPLLVAYDEKGQESVSANRFCAISPDRGHFVLFSSYPYAGDGDRLVLVAVDGEGKVAFKVGKPSGGYSYYRWASDGSCVEGCEGGSGDPWVRVPGTERSPLALPRDVLVSPNASLRIECVDTGGPKDVFVAAASSASGAGSNVSSEDE